MSVVAGVEDLGDVGVVHQRQGLALGLEAGDDLLGVHAGLDDLQGHLAADGLRLLGHVDDAHAPLADLLQQLVGADDRAGPLGRGGASSTVASAEAGDFEEARLLARRPGAAPRPGGAGPGRSPQACRGRPPVASASLDLAGDEEDRFFVELHDVHRLGPRLARPSPSIGQCENRRAIA